MLRIFPTFSAQKSLAVEKRVKSQHPAAAPVAKLIHLPRVDFKGDPDLPVSFADQLNPFLHPVGMEIEDLGFAAIVGELHLACGPGKIVPVVVDN